MAARKHRSEAETPRSPELGSVPEWRAKARALGWREPDLRGIDTFLTTRTPNDDGRDAVVVLVLARRIVTATPQRVDRGTRYERVMWGYSGWTRSIEITGPKYAAGPHGYRWCDAHSAYCPEDAAPGHDASRSVEFCGQHAKYCHHDEHGCTRERDYAATLRRLEGVLELDHGGCDCRRALLGEHYPGCRHFEERGMDWDAMYRELAHPKRVVKRKIDDVRPLKGVLPGQTKLF